MGKIKFKALAALLLVGALLAGITYDRAGASTDSWSQHNESVVPFSTAVTLGAAPSIICTAVSGTSFNVRARTITNSASGVVGIYNGATLTGSALIGCWGLIANTPLNLTEDMLGQGLATTSGNGLYVNGATGTITLTARVRKDR